MLCVFQQAQMAAAVAKEMEAWEQEQAKQEQLREEAQANQEKALERQRQQRDADNLIREEDERKYDENTA